MTSAAIIQWVLSKIVRGQTYTLASDLQRRNLRSQGIQGMQWGYCKSQAGSSLRNVLKVGLRLGLLGLNMVMMVL